MAIQNSSLPQSPIPSVPLSNNLNTIKPKKPLNTFIIWLIIATILVILLIVGYFILNKPKENSIGENNSINIIPSNIPTITTSQITLIPTESNLKTYVNSKYNYSLKYPGNTNLVFIDCSNKPQLPVNDWFILADKENSGCEGQGEGYIISIKNSGGEYECKSTESWQTSSSVITVGDLIGSKCISTFIGKEQILPGLSGPSEITDVSISKNGVFLDITLNDPKYSKLFNDLISTITFSSPIPSNSVN